MYYRILGEGHVHLHVHLPCYGQLLSENETTMFKKPKGFSKPFLYLSISWNSGLCIMFPREDIQNRPIIL